MKVNQMKRDPAIKDPAPARRPAATLKPADCETSDRVPQVGGFNTMLRVDAEILLGLVGDLENRLSSVLSQAAPKPPAGEKNPEPALCSLASTMRETHMALQEVITRIEQISSRIEVP
ncbi:MAG: hypothetical protein NVV63_12640 [Opitutus sp.]|nr:hypothetical protein [Opitutus sp.]